MRKSTECPCCGFYLGVKETKGKKFTLVEMDCERCGLHKIKVVGRIAYPKRMHGTSKKAC